MWEKGGGAFVCFLLILLLPAWTVLLRFATRKKWKINEALAGRWCVEFGDNLIVSRLLRALLFG